jgi:hypothetical protein
LADSEPGQAGSDQVTRDEKAIAQRLTRAIAAR